MAFSTTITTTEGSTLAPYTNATPLPIVITFGMDVEDFAREDITVTGGTVISLTPDIGDPLRVFNANINVTAQGGTVTIQVPAGVAEEDGVGTQLNSASNIITRTFSTIKPTCEIIHDIDPISSDSRHYFEVHFSEDVQFFIEDDFEVSNCDVELISGASDSIYGGYVLPTNPGEYSFKVKGNAATDKFGNTTSESSKVVLEYENDHFDDKTAATFSTFTDTGSDVEILGSFNVAEVKQVAAIQSLADCAKDLPNRLKDLAIKKAMDYILNTDSAKDLLEKKALIEKNLATALSLYEKINSYIENPKTLLMEVLEAQGLTGAALQAKTQEIADKFSDVVGLDEILKGIDTIGICDSPDYYPSGAAAPAVMKNPVGVPQQPVQLPPVSVGTTYTPVAKDEYDSFVFQLKHHYSPTGGEDSMKLSMLTLVCTLVTGFHDTLSKTTDNTKDAELLSKYKTAVEAERVRNVSWAPEIMTDFNTRAAAAEALIIQNYETIRRYFMRNTVMPSNGTFDSRRALAIAASDNAISGYCARGVANICEAMQLGNFRGLDAHDWVPRFSTQGYYKIEGATMTNAPIGSILWFDSDVHQGRAPRNKGGGKYGHVEIVADDNGKRVYISDKARTNPGGSVYSNFGGAYARRA